MATVESPLLVGCIIGAEDSGRHIVTDHKTRPATGESACERVGSMERGVYFRRSIVEIHQLLSVL
jgi:hypothetical protein